MPRLPRSSAVLLGAALAAALAAGCTHAPWQPYRGWSASKGKNVTVYTDTLLEHRTPQEWLERSYAAYAGSFFKDMKLRPVEAIYLQGEPPGSMERPLFPNEDPPSAWTLATVPGRGAIGKSGLVVLGTRSVRAAQLQLGHHFIATATPSAPLWFHVGFSRYLASYRMHYSKRGWSVCFGSFSGFTGPRPLADREAVLIPVGDLWTSDWYGWNDDHRRWYAYTAYALVDYLVHGKGEWSSKRFPLLLKALADGKSPEEAILAARPDVVFGELDEALEAHVRKRQRPYWNTVKQGACFAIDPATHADATPRRSRVAEDDVRAALDGLARLPLYRKHASYYPADIVAAEARKRPVPAESRPGVDIPAAERAPLEVRGVR